MEVPQLKVFPYKTTKQCEVCHPADLQEPPYYNCITETARAGTQVVRSLECPNCGARDTDIYDVVRGVVVFDHAIDIQAARGVRRG